MKVEYFDNSEYGFFIKVAYDDYVIVTQTFLTKEQVQLMKDKLTEHGDLQLKTYALFSLSTMARVNAVANVKWEQIDFENRIVKDVLEKEGKIVDLFFSKEVKELLLQLQREREVQKINDYGWVFYSGYNTEDKPISTGTLNEWCKRIGKMIDVPSLHAHDMRHSFSNILYQSGMALEDVSSLLHHSGTDVTKKHYLKEDVSRLTKIKDQFEI